MNMVYRVLIACLLQLPSCGLAQDPDDSCSREDVRLHVLQQFELYGPKSDKHEYFGFIYRSNDAIDSTVIRSSECKASGGCVVRTADAVKRVPSGAKILGEWHTHPHHGSRSLSQLDVRGAYYNRHIVCYSAYFSTPAGEIYSWDVNDASVPTAMASRQLIGNYPRQMTAERR